MDEITEKLSQLKIRPHGQHSLPFPHFLPSRLCTSIIFSLHGLSKDVIILNLVLCQGSRDFIITQEGLKGFLKRVHDNLNSLFCELKLSKDFARKVGIFVNQESIGQLASKLDKLKEEEKMQFLRHHHPAVFVGSLKALERNDELVTLIGDDNERNQTWRILSTLNPEL